MENPDENRYNPRMERLLKLRAQRLQHNPSDPYNAEQANAGDDMQREFQFQNRYQDPDPNPIPSNPHQYEQEAAPGQVWSPEPAKNTENFPTVGTELASVRQNKRLYPIKPKERVFDEWAAIQTHVDEVNKLSDLRERELIRLRKEQYRRELEDQRREMEMRNMRSNKGRTEEERKLLEGQMSNLKSFQSNDTEKQEHNKMLAVNIMEENIRAKSLAMRRAKELEQVENQAVIDSIRQNSDLAKQMDEYDRQKRLKTIGDLKRSYDEQEEIKRLRNEKLRQLDRVYSDQYKEKLTNDEQNHQRYFDLMRQKQMMNDLRAKNYQYSVQPKLLEQQQKDEETAQRAMQERMKREAQRERNEKNERHRANVAARDLWKEQLEQKQRKQSMEKREDELYAIKLKQSLEEQAERERQMKEAQMKDRQRYREVLEKQIDHANKKKIYIGVMSEHERKTNKVDLDAYENMQADLLNAKMIGIKDYSSVTLNPPSRVVQESREQPRPQPVQNEPKPDLYSSPQYKNSTLVNAAYKPYCERLLEPTIKNMLDPNVVLLRNDTHNLAYGYKNQPGPDKYFHPLYSKAGYHNPSTDAILNPLKSAGMSQVLSPREGMTNAPADYYKMQERQKNVYPDYDMHNSQVNNNLS